MIDAGFHHEGSHAGRERESMPAMALSFPKRFDENVYTDSTYEMAIPSQIACASFINVLRCGDYHAFPSHEAQAKYKQRLVASPHHLDVLRCPDALTGCQSHQHVQHQYITK
jgi:hypothetical protein